MYAAQTPRELIYRLTPTLWAVLGSVLLCSTTTPTVAQTQVIRNITQASERLELTVNTSRILTLDKRIPRMVVNNPELVTVTPISANQVQLAARKPGVTQVNLWDEDDQVYTVDVLIYGDVRELELALQRLFPESSVKVVRLTNSLVLEGYVEKPEAVSPIVRLAEDYAPKVVNNITVGGVHQVLLKVKVMEVSRTKLRNFGHDFALVFPDEGFAVSKVSESLLASAIGTGEPASAGGDFAYGVLGQNAAFFGFLKALQENKIAKVLADPTITTVSGRPAKFNVGGEFPIVLPSGLGQSTIEFKDFGTRVDFVPIVLGNGNIRLEVYPRVSERDDANGIKQNGFDIPALRVREVNTAVEMKAGQTLALAGLIQTRVESQKRGLPYLSDIPYLGAAFRSVGEEVNEIELLIMVTPELVDSLDPCEVPPCGPGMETVSPSNTDLYWRGYLEVPACGACTPNGCSLNCANSYNQPTASCAVSTDQSACSTCGPMVQTPYQQPAANPQWYDQTEIEPTIAPLEPAEAVQPKAAVEQPAATVAPALTVPPTPQPVPAEPAGPAMGSPAQPTPGPDPTAMQSAPTLYQASRPTIDNRQNPQNATRTTPPAGGTSTPGLIGPLGYDM